jgi:hypothetical protein
MPKSTTSTGPKKKPVFKAIGGSSQALSAMPISALGVSTLDPSRPETANEDNDPSGAVRNGWYAERYDPRVISGCGSDCRACGGSSGSITL